LALTEVSSQQGISLIEKGVFPLNCVGFVKAYVNKGDCPVDLDCLIKSVERPEGMRTDSEIYREGE